MVDERKDKKGRRVTIDLTPRAAEEVEKLRISTGRTTADLFRFSLQLLRIYVNATEEGKEMVINDPKSDTKQTRLILPLSIG